VMRSALTWTLLSALVASTLSFAPPAEARSWWKFWDRDQQPQQEQGYHQEMTQEKAEKKSEWMVEEIDKAAQLNDQQRQRIQTISQQRMQQIEPLKQDLKMRKKELMLYTASPQATMEEARRRQMDILRLEQQIGDLKLAKAFEMKAQLTPDQQRRVQEHMAMKMKKMH
jgi:hypothetical protein